MPNLTQDKLRKTKELGILPTDIRNDMIARSGYPYGRGMPGMLIVTGKQIGRAHV